MSRNLTLYKNKKTKKYYIYYDRYNAKREISEKLYKVLNYCLTSPNTLKSFEHKFFEKFINREHDFVGNRVNFGISMFDCEKESLSNLDESKEIIFLGFPYDLGSSNYAGSRMWPYSIRKSSASIYEMNNSSFHKFLFKIKDIGDINRRVFKTNSFDFDYCSNIIEILSSKNKIPIILGGDHSISYSTIKGMVSSHKDIGIIQFDAHQDFQSRIFKRNWRENMHHGNFLNWVVPEKEIRSIYQFGIDKYTKIYKDEKLKVYTVDETLDNLDDILFKLDKTIPYYITFDVDCLSTELITSTGTIIPGGFTYREISKIINKLKEYKINIIGIDFVELNDKNEVDSLNISRIILDFINILR